MTAIILISTFAFIAVWAACALITHKPTPRK